MLFGYDLNEIKHKRKTEDSGEERRKRNHGIIFSGKEQQKRDLL